jgi:hypothetical protein
MFGLSDSGDAHGAERQLPLQRLGSGFLRENEVNAYQERLSLQVFRLPGKSTTNYMFSIADYLYLYRSKVLRNSSEIINVNSDDGLEILTSVTMKRRVLTN